MIIIKTPDEIKLIREACRITAQVLLNVEKEIMIGTTTFELDRLAEGLIAQYGAAPAFKGYRGYRFTSCISVNSEVVHGFPSKRELKEGDIVGFDVGVVYQGYYGDSTRTFPVGRVSKQAQKLLKCAKESLDLAIKRSRTGNHVGDISAAVESHTAAYGFSVVRDLFGHGVGKSLHEDPLIPNYGIAGTGVELKPGMVLAIEPMINAGASKIATLDDGWTVVTADGSLSAHFEDTILVTENEPEILTRI
ncbi:type I methionyl aminopeptidase [Candidatus Saganbacteria bacterium]|nr:type I methionyl aminopeptidase [Candidatus Saganbacteria bacterium]